MNTTYPGPALWQIGTGMVPDFAINVDPAGPLMSDALKRQLKCLPTGTRIIMTHRVSEEDPCVQTCEFNEWRVGCKPDTCDAECELLMVPMVPAAPLGDEPVDTMCLDVGKLIIA